MTGLARALLALGALGAALAAVAVALTLSSGHVEDRALNAAVGGLLMVT